MCEPATRPIPPLPAHRYAKTQALAEALVAEALEDHPPSPDYSMRANSVRLLAGMWFVHGSMNFPRGWVAPASPQPNVSREAQAELKKMEGTR